MNTLIKFPQYRVGEIFQALEIKMAFVSKLPDNVYKQCHLAIKCRDFLGDCIWSKETGQLAHIYGFEYNYKSSPFDEEELRLSLTFPDEEGMTNFKDNFNTYMASKKIEASFELTTDPLSVIVKADKKWQSAQWKLSLFTFYLKVCSYKNETCLRDPEDKYIKCFEDKGVEKKLLEAVDKDIKHIFDNINMAHNYSGFVSVCSRRNEELYQAILGG